jgi:hypothetical protein
MDQVLFNSNHLLFTIWNFLSVETLLISCTSVNRAWTLHLCGIIKQESNGKRKFELDNEHYATSRYSNYFFRRTELELTHLPPLLEMKNQYTMKHLFERLPNLWALTLESNFWSSWFLVSREELTIVWNDVLQFCPLFARLNFTSCDTNAIILIVNTLSKCVENIKQYLTLSLNLTHYHYSRIAMEWTIFPPIPSPISLYPKSWSLLTIYTQDNCIYLAVEGLPKPM